MNRTARSALERRRRASARFALYCSLAAIALVGWALTRLAGWSLATAPSADDGAERWADVDFARHPAVQMLQRYVAIDTSPTTGSEERAATFLAEQLASAGIRSHVERLGRGRANLWAIVEGTDPRAIVLHHHMDVTAAGAAASWTHPAFSGTIAGPWIYGRGVYDMKSLAVAQLMALLDLKRSGRPLERSVILLATSGEEAGSDLGTKWILRMHPDLVARFGTVLTEGGVVEATTPTRVKYWGIEFAQKRFARGAFCAADRERLVDLGHDLNDWARPTTRLSAPAEVREFLAAYGPTRDRLSYRELLSAPDRVLADPAAIFELSEFMQSLFRNELIVFEPKTSAGGGWEAPAVFHLLPGVELAAVLDELSPANLTAGTAQAFRLPEGASHGSPTDHPDFLVLLDTTRELHPGTVVGPYFLAWSATDSRFFREAGIPSYGYSPFVIVASDTFSMDLANERMGLPGFISGVRLYAEVLRRLVT